jgi:tetratricopeptide (TPR) repeat protein
MFFNSVWAQSKAAQVILPPGDSDRIVTITGREPSAGRQEAPGKPILIYGAQVSSDNSLTINGDSFGTDGPIVNLDGRVLAVSSSSNTQIIAQLPGILAPGVHMLTVSSGPESSEFALFNLRIRQAEPDTPQVTRGARELREAGEKEYSLGHFAAAQALLEKAMPLAVQENDAYLIALVHDGLGRIYQDERLFTKSEREFKQAVDILRQQPLHSQALAMTLVNFGTVLCADQRCREASAVISEASRIVKKNAINDPSLRVHILNVSATVYLSERQLKKAEATFLEALRISQETAAIPETVDVYNNLGILYTFKGDYPKAVGSYTRALETTEKQFGPAHPMLVTILENLGFTYIRMSRYDEAELQFTRDLSILEHTGLTATTMGLKSLYALGRISMEKNQLDRAQSLLGRAVETGRAISARTPEMAETLELYGKVLGLLSKNSEAENLHTEAARIRAELALTTRAVR